MSLPESTDVLIVGAGPAGLGTAVSLLTQGITNITIVDAQPGGVNISRAIVIHARTVEELATIGCADELTRRGLHASSMSVRARKQLLVRANFAGLAPYTKYPFALLISQAETEYVLEQRLKELGVSVVRPFKMTGLEGIDTGVKVTFETGEVVRAKYVVGADGSRSTVRRLAGIPFRDPGTKKDPHAVVAKDGDSAKQDNKKFGLPLIISDVYLTGHIPPCINPNELSTFLGPLGFLLLVPLPADRNDPEKRPIYRLSCPQEKGKKEVTLARLQQVVDAALGLPKAETPKVDTIISTSRFRVRSAVADKFYQYLGGGVVTIVGDAAHVHSPAGGQGMNLGLRDAIDLGQTLAKIIKFEASAASPSAQHAFADQHLEAFSAERRKLAMGVIKLTKVMTWATGLKSTPARKARNGVWSLLGRTSKVPNRFALKLSGLEPNRKK